MRTQSGATSLRALLYMDEIYGYLPPQRNPPSKVPLLRMLKQARAFGLGFLLATQNPVDVDYKALSNAGTWFIGKLQTEQDKNRLLDGLESASGGVTRNVFDKLISTLGKRVFVLHNVHSKTPELLQTRWVMNFLAGPTTRTQIPALNALANALGTPDQAKPQRFSAPQPVPSAGSTQPSFMASVPPQPKQASTAASPAMNGSQTKPSLPSGIREFFLPQNFSLPEAFKAAQQSMPAEAMIESVVYKPALLASAQVRILDRKLGVDSEVTRVAVVEKLEKRGAVRWEDFVINGKSLDQVETVPIPSARFGTVDLPLNDSKLMTALQKDFTDWVFRNSSVTARVNQALKVYAGPDVSQAEFMKACADAARAARDAEFNKLAARLDKQIATLEDKLSREERELRQDEAELAQRKMEAMGTHAENVLGLFVGSRSTRKLSSSLTKHRMTEQAKADVDESVEAIAQFKNQLAELDKERLRLAEEVNARWGNVVNQNNEAVINPKKTDVYVNLFGVGWMPYYLVKTNADPVELPAFGVG